jgi:predicted nucleic acid-binding protein
LIFLDTNVISETLRKTPNPAVIAWLVRNDAELALPTVTIAEIAFGIGKFRLDQRAARLGQGLAAWRHRFCRPDLLPHGSGCARLMATS